MFQLMDNKSFSLSRITILILIIILLSMFFINAQVSENANYKKIFNSSKGKYGVVTLEEKQELKEKVTNIELLSNTEQCVECSAILKIDVNKNKPNLLSLINIRKSPQGFQFNKNFKKSDTMFWDKKNVNQYGLTFQILEDTIKTNEHEPSITYTVPEWKTVTLNQLNNKLNQKGVHYVKLIAKKDEKEILDWTPTFFGDLEVFDWAIWGTTYVYDEINDSYINLTLWNYSNTCSGECNPPTGGQAIYSITENTDYIYGLANAYHSNSGSSTVNVKINSTNMSSINNINNVTLQAYVRGACGSDSSCTNYALLNVFGNVIISKSCTGSTSCSQSDTSIWDIKKNISAGTNKYDIYDDGVYSTQITASNNVIHLEAYADIPLEDKSSSGEFRLYYVYYSLYANQTIVTQNYPTNNMIVSGLPLQFNCTATPIDSGVNVTSITLYIDNSSILTQNFTGIGAKTFIASNNVSVGNHSWFCQSNDTFFDFINSSMRMFNVPSFVANGNSYSQSVTANTVVEGSLVTFNLNLNLTSYSPSSAYLYYNGIQYSPSTSDVNNNIINFEKTMVIPNNTGNSTGKSIPWYWIFTVDSVVTNQTTDTMYQTVYSVSIDNCSVYTDNILSFLLEDEGTNIIINSSLIPKIEVDVILSNPNDQSVIFSYHTIFNSNNGSLCIPNYVLNISDLRIDTIASYEAQGYVKEFWYLDNGLLQFGDNNFDAYTTRNITLRDLLVADSTTFLFKFYDENYLQQPNAIVTVLRDYIGEGTFKEVERAKQDNNGETHIHLVQEDIIYKFRVTLDGELLYESDSYNAKCLQTPCSITLQKPLAGEGAVSTEWDNLPEGTYRLTANSINRTVNLAYNLNNTGTMNLTVYEYSYDTNQEYIVGSNSATSKTGSISVVVPVVVGNKTFYAKVYHNNAYVTTEYVDFKESGYTYFGTLGLFLAFLLILTLGLIAISQGVWVIVFILLGFVISVVTGFLNMQYYLIAWIISAGLILIIKLSIRRGGFG